MAALYVVRWKMAIRPATMMMTGQLLCQERTPEVSSRKRTPMRMIQTELRRARKTPELVAGSAVVGEAGASVGHSADEDPDAEADQNYWDEPMSGKGVEESRVADEKQATKSDEPDRASGETITRKRRKIGVDGVSGRSIRMNRGDWWHGGNVVVGAVPGCVPVCGSGLRGIRVGGGV